MADMVASKDICSAITSRVLMRLQSNTDCVLDNEEVELLSKRRYTYCFHAHRYEMLLSAEGIIPDNCTPEGLDGEQWRVGVRHDQMQRYAYGEVIQYCEESQQYDVRLDSGAKNVSVSETTGDIEWIQTNGRMHYLSAREKAKAGQSSNQDGLLKVRQEPQSQLAPSSEGVARHTNCTTLLL